MRRHLRSTHLKSTDWHLITRPEYDPSKFTNVTPESIKEIFDYYQEINEKLNDLRIVGDPLNAVGRHAGDSSSHRGRCLRKVPN